MNRQTSLYLDVVRFLAAMVVFIGHISGQRFTAGLFWQFGPYMDEAVTVFFVLSGFVIGYVADRRESTARAFAVARAARIYSVALPAIAATLLLDAMGLALRPDLYSTTWGFHGDHTLLKAVASVFFVNRLWFQQIAVGSLLPYWSLACEVWYYAIFGMAVFARGWWRAVGVAALLLLVGPRIAALMPIWLLGVVSYRICARGGLPRPLAAPLWAGTALAFLGWDAWVRANGVPNVAPGFLNFPHLANDYVVGLLFALNLIGFSGMGVDPALGSPRLARAIRWFAGASFTIYLFHVPLAQFFTTVVPWPATSPLTRLVMFGGAFVAMLAVAEVTERRKELWRRAFERLFALRFTLGASPAPSR